MGAELSHILKDQLPYLNYKGFTNRILNNICSCRTIDMGYHKVKCDNKECNHQEITFNSCRSRYCPKCQGSNQIQWKHNRINDLIPVNHSHIIFKVPRSLFETFQYNNKECYNLLFQTTSETIKQICSSKRFNGDIGFISMLHTWDQKINNYPHIHCLIPEGGIKYDKSKWIPYSPQKLLKRTIIETLYKINFIKNLGKLTRKERIVFKEDIMDKAKRSNFHVYIKSSFGDSARVINYLGNFINKTAITNSRIKEYKDNKVTYTYRDRSDGNKIKDHQLEANTFIKRFIIHILPKRFKRIRYYGFLANNCRKENIEFCKKIINNTVFKIKKLDIKTRDCISKLIKNLNKKMKCPCCKKGFLVLDTFSTARYGPL